LLFLERAPDDRIRAAVALTEAERHHALRVLRLAAGDVVEARDGRGGCYRVRVTRADRRDITCELAEPARHEPPPGAPGAPLPRIELAVAWPRDARGEDMLARLVQLGVAAVRPLAMQHTGADRRADRRERLERILVENLKQCGRAWLPELAEPAPLAAVLATWSGAEPAPVFALDPRAERDLATQLVDQRGAEALRLVVGPEGGFAPPELAALDAAGALRARLGPHVLRIETAAEAACALAACLLERRATTV
jgi:16S rRNA (uracil1498-N3)-methyltransferase